MFDERSYEICVVDRIEPEGNSLVIGCQGRERTVDEVAHETAAAFLAAELIDLGFDTNRDALREDIRFLGASCAWASAAPVRRRIVGNGSGHGDVLTGGRRGPSESADPSGSHFLRKTLADLADLNQEDFG